MPKGSGVAALQRGLKCLFKTLSSYQIQTPPILFQGVLYESVKTTVRLKSKLHKTMRSRYYGPGSAQCAI